MGFNLFMSIPTLPITVFLMNLFANYAMKTGILEWVFTSSIESLLRLLKGESRTMPAIELSLAACMIEVTAPMDLPQRPIKETLSVDLR